LPNEVPTILMSLSEKTRKSDHIPYWCQCKGGAFSSVILRPWVELLTRLDPWSPS
jgi:hypothetical protein